VEGEDLEYDAGRWVDRACEGAHFATEDVLNRPDEEVFGRCLQVRARFADAIGPAALDHRSLGGQQRVLERADERVTPREIAPSVGWAAAELLFVELDDAVRDRRECRAGLGRVGLGH